MRDDKTVSIMLDLPPLPDRIAGKTNFWSHVLSEDVLPEIQSATDRVMAIVATATIEDRLKDLLSVALLPGGDDRERTLAPEGALGAFMPRVKLCHMLGLFGEDIRHDLALIARIRNAFAHRAAGVSFEDAVVAKHCQKLRTPVLWTQRTAINGGPGDGLMISSPDADGQVRSIRVVFFERDEKLSDNRWRFEASVQMISYVLARVKPVIPAQPRL